MVPLPLRVRSLRALAVALATLAVPTVARADLLTYDGNVAGESVTFKYNGSTETAFAGQYAMHLSGQPTGSLLTFCVDLAHQITKGESYGVTSTLLSKSGFAAAGEIGYLVDTFGATKLTNNEIAAGLQMAIWKLLADGTSSTSITSSGGNFQYLGSDTTLINDANAFLLDAKGQSANATYLQEDKDSWPVGQGMCTVPPSGAPTPVPEPTSALLLSVGAVGWFGYRRCRRSMRPRLDSERKKLT